ncbi:hypothetical protein O9570_12140 [Achromobacter xylosoxidans]|jgi:hypothetical protein|uniref:Transmembrane protein n=1 Tax=Alcaligenes xylosoxydans xylosoxydans TaxID=85698 RepID=A0A9X3R4L3_ALCXX|nr:hypothetical protein [Achromobacter xylosoxidans]MCZ8402199.1 hypothetical protein [Achromobacter xylosoxidans]
MSTQEPHTLESPLQRFRATTPAKQVKALGVIAIVLYACAVFALLFIRPLPVTPGNQSLTELRATMVGIVANSNEHDDLSDALIQIEGLSASKPVRIPFVKGSISFRLTKAGTPLTVSIEKRGADFRVWRVVDDLNVPVFREDDVLEVANRMRLREFSTALSYLIFAIGASIAALGWWFYVGRPRLFSSGNRSKQEPEK